MEYQLSTFTLFFRLTSVFSEAVTIPSLLHAIESALKICHINSSFQLFLGHQGKLFVATAQGLIEKRPEETAFGTVLMNELSEGGKIIKKGRILLIPVSPGHFHPAFLVAEAGNGEDEEEIFRVISNLTGMALKNIPAKSTFSIQEQELFNLLNLLPIIVSIKDRSGRFVFINDFCRRTLDMSNDIIGKTYSEIFPEHTAAELRKLDENVWNGKRAEIGKYSIDHDESKKHYLTGRSRISIGGKDLLVTYSIDISREVDAVASLTLSELKYRQLVEKASDFIFRCDPGGKILYINQVGLEMLGKTLQEAQQMNYLEMIRSDYREEVLHFIREQFRNRTPSVYFEAPVITPLGEIWLGANINMETEGDWVLGYNILARNITEQRRMEQELIKAKQEAERLSKTKEQFLSVMSHELRTPMNAVVGMANLLLEADYLPRQKQYLDVLKIASDNLLNILNNVLDLSKIEAGKLRQERFRFSLRETLNKILQTFRYKTEEKGIGYSIEIADNVPDILWGDQLKLNQVLLNLVSNAVKFTDSGSISVTVRLYKKSLSDIILSFTVEDTGIGIEENRISEIFDSFTQANSEISSRYGGTGLGLTITKKLIEFLDGKIRVKSNPGKGSVFSFTLPFGFKEFEQIPGPELDEQPVSDDLSGLEILIAEDNEMNQLLIKEFLSGKGILADLVQNGEEAVQRIKKKMYHLILMDLQMPVMDGYTAARIIKMKLKKKIPVIALTASTSLSGDNDKYFDDLISKPFDPKILFSKIATLTGREFLIKDKKPERRMSSNTVTNLSYLKEASAGNEQFIREMINIFLRQTPGYLRDLRKLGDKNDWGEFRKVMHKIKPTISMMGIYSLEPVIRQIEVCSKENRNIEQLPGLLDELERVCQAAFKELKKELGGNA